MSAVVSDGPGVIARPPAIYQGFLIAGVVLEYGWPTSLATGAARYPLGGALVTAGVIVMTLAVRRFRLARTPVETYQPTTAIVTDGIYAHSRNPMYLSLTFLYAGIAVLADSRWILALLAPILIIMRGGVIAREERYL
ncbi:MAG: methyltransferase [Gammaproteobacteria bacterium]